MFIFGLEIQIRGNRELTSKYEIFIIIKNSLNYSKLIFC